MALQLDDILRDLVQREGTDLHLKVGQPPFFRVHGRLLKTDYPILTPQSIRELIYPILADWQIQRLETQLELDLAYELPGVSRFRVNLFHQQGNLGGVFRVIPSRVRTIDELMLPQVLKKIAMLRRGLVLVTGPTGCGKTTTLAAMIDYINENRRAHIITIEEPIEYWHQDKQCSITQREVGIDTESYAEALRHVTRQNPDVILVGEMRDLETISLWRSMQRKRDTWFSAQSTPLMPLRPLTVLLTPLTQTANLKLGFNCQALCKQSSLSNLSQDVTNLVALQRWRL
jgi:twitching motility protein PilT